MSIETWTTCDEVPLDAVQKISPLRAALWEFYRNLPNGRTWEQFQALSNDHVLFNKLWCYALKLPGWNEGKPPPENLRQINPTTGELLT